MPYALKGIDAVLFAVFSSLGVKVHVRPVLDNDAWSREDVDITRSGTRFEDIVMMDATDEDLTSDVCRVSFSRFTSCFPCPHTPLPGWLFCLSWRWLMV